MEARITRYGPLPMMVAAVVMAGALMGLLYPLFGRAVASTVGMGGGVAFAVYLDRRWLRPVPSALRQSVEYGAATAFGWVLGQIIISIW